MERASHRVFGLPPGLQTPGAAANGTHRHLHARGAQPTACCHSNPSRVRPFAALRGASRAGDRAPLTCTQRAVRRALKLPLLPQMARAAADGTHRHLHARGGPADGVLQLKLARACVV